MADTTTPEPRVHWTGRVRCGLCGDERRLEDAAAAVDPLKRYPCLAGCQAVIDGKATARLSCYQVEG